MLNYWGCSQLCLVEELLYEENEQNQCILTAGIWINSVIMVSGSFT